MNLISKYGLYGVVGLIFGLYACGLFKPLKVSYPKKYEVHYYSSLEGRWQFKSFYEGDHSNYFRYDSGKFIVIHFDTAGSIFVTTGSDTIIKGRTIKSLNDSDRYIFSVPWQGTIDAHRDRISIYDHSYWRFNLDHVHFSKNNTAKDSLTYDRLVMALNTVDSFAIHEGTLRLTSRFWWKNRWHFPADTIVLEKR